jgi:hypothetical protein
MDESSSAIKIRGGCSVTGSLSDLLLPVALSVYVGVPELLRNSPIDELTVQINLHTNYFGFQNGTTAVLCSDMTNCSLVTKVTCLMFFTITNLDLQA